VSTVTSLPRRGPLEVSNTPRVSRRWMMYFVAITFATFVISFRHTWLGMVQTWYSSRTYSHCFLIVPMFLYLAWLRRKELVRLGWEPQYQGVAFFAIFSVLWLIGNLGDVRVVQEFAFVAMAVSIVWAVFGTEIARRLRFPLAFLFFAVPFGLGLIGPLQDFTAWFTVHALNLTNIPAVLQNHTLSVPSGSWTVAEACSGIRYLFASLVLGTFFASLIYRSRQRQVLFVAASAIVPVLANGLRAYLVVLVAHLSSNRLAAGVDHVVYGGLFFVVVETVFLGLGLRWREASAQDWIETSNLPGAISAPKRSAWPAGRGPLVCAALVVLCALSPRLATHLWERSTTAGWSEPRIAVSAPWQQASTNNSWAPLIAGADRSYQQSYVSDHGKVQLRYGLFTRSVSIVDSYNLFTDPKFWSAFTRTSAVATINGQRVLVDETVFSGPVTRTVWTWYWVNGEYTSSESRVKWLQARARLLGKPSAGLAITVGVDALNDEPRAASKVLQDFVEHSTVFPPTLLPS
jgi:exosortase A